ncbi:MAG: tungstate ABC transporter substrate-binding protein WtpA [Candidatus Njordarchaeales archaeon]
MDKKVLMLVLLISVVCVSFIGVYIYYPQFFTTKQRLVIFHAGSLEVPFSNLEKTFESLHPDIDVVREAYGSRTAAKQITELNRTADILAVADYKVITTLLFPRNLTDWYIIFAHNEMVLAYTNQSAYHDEINSTNWFEIINRTGVTVGHSDPDADPCGYRSLLVLKLAEIYYNISGIYKSIVNSSHEIVRPKSVELISLLEAGELDYAFEYKSVAVQHKLNYVELPSEINLAEYQYADYYSQVNITLSDGTLVIGESILYGITIPKNAQHVDLAIEFIKLLLSDQGQEEMSSAVQPPISPALTNDIEAIPSELQDYVTQWNG